MPTLSDLIKKHTDLDTEDLEWIHSLVSDWQLLADLSFADLVLWVPKSSGRPAARGEADSWVAVAQIRPTTGPTAYPEDLVGVVAGRGRRNLVDIASRESRAYCGRQRRCSSASLPVRSSH